MPSIPLYNAPKMINHNEPLKNEETYSTGKRDEVLVRPFDKIAPGSPKRVDLQGLVE